MTYKLLDRFERLFREGPYRHRVSTNGDKVALELYEDLYALGRSRALSERVGAGLCVVSGNNQRQGVRARRGDGSFGEIVPHMSAALEPGYTVPRGPLATIEIGIEVKILAKAMIKQIERVCHDLTGQVSHFNSKGGKAISVGIAGINHAAPYVSFEGETRWVTTGQAGKYHPAQEAREAQRRLELDAVPAFDEFLFLHFKASNHEPVGGGPYDFEWVDKAATEADYGAILARVSQRYEAIYR